MNAHPKALENSKFARLWLDRAARPDRNDGQRGLWLKLLDRLELDFTC